MEKGACLSPKYEAYMGTKDTRDARQNRVMKPPVPPPHALPAFAELCVVDTNVILVANGQHPAVSAACVQTCRDWLGQIMAHGRIVLDDGFEILHEYRHKTDPQAGQGVGDAFVRWVLHHVNDASRCELVHLEADPVWGFRHFPHDERLWDFDPADRKFVAVACSHPQHPPILQAADSKWVDWAPCLSEFGVAVHFLCDCEVHQFHLHKFGR